MKINKWIVRSNDSNKSITVSGTKKEAKKAGVAKFGRGNATIVPAEAHLRMEGVTLPCNIGEAE